MARPKSLAAMSLDALMKLRDDVSEILGQQAAAIQEQLARLTDLGTGRGRGNSRAGKLKGRKAPVKYRDSNGNTWSGRGAQPRWMTAAIKTGAKREDFLVGSVAKKSARPARPAKKAIRAKRPAKAATRAKRRVARSKAKATTAAKRRVARPAAKLTRPAKPRVARVPASAEVSPAPAPSPQS